MKAVSILLVLAFLLVLSVDSLAQATRGVSSAGRRIDDFDNQRTKAQRDAMAREMRPRKPSKQELQNAARIKAETKEDLEGLQHVYNDIVGKLNVRDEIPAAYVAESAGKVNKHALRLKANVAFPKPEEEEAVAHPTSSDDARKLLRDLCASIYDLLTDPMIENPQVLDIEAAAKARSSLESVIALSERLSHN